MTIPDEAIDAAAKAMALRDHNDTDAWTAYKKDARAALEAAAPLLGRVITGYDELDDLPVETVIRTDWGTVREKNDRGYWYEMGSDYANGIECGSFPVTVIYQPEAVTTQLP